MPPPPDLSEVLPLVETLVLESDPIVRDRILFEAVWQSGIAAAAACWREEPGTDGRPLWRAQWSRGEPGELPDPALADAAEGVLRADQRLWSSGARGQRLCLGLGGVHGGEEALDLLEALFTLSAALAPDPESGPAPLSPLPQRRLLGTPEEQRLARLDHDLRNVLASIRTQSELIEDLGPSLAAGERERRQRCLEAEIARAAAFLLPESPASGASVSLQAAVERTVEAEQPLFEALGLVLRLETHAGLADLHVGLSPAEIGRLLQNLLANARRACRSSRAARPAGEDWDVRVLLLRPSGSPWVTLVVEDHGPGLPEGEADRLFDAGVSIGSHGGSGLGLAVVRELAQRAGGGVSASTRRQGGSRFEANLLVTKT